MDFEESQPAHVDGAPADLQAGAHINRIYEEIRDLRADIKTQGEDIAFIKGKLSGENEAKTQKNDTSNRKVMIIAAAISGSIAALIGLFKI